MIKMIQDGKMYGENSSVMECFTNHSASFTSQALTSHSIYFKTPGGQNHMPTGPFLNCTEILSFF